MKSVSSVISLMMLLTCVSLASAQVPLDKVLSNLSFEDDPATPVDWIPTQPNQTNYTLDAFEVNPSITPLGAETPLVAPAGVNFVGVTHAADENISGKLVHLAAAVNDPDGTTYTVTVWGNRGRLAGAMPYPAQPSRLLMTFTGWGPGDEPVVNPTTDDWSRKPLVKKVQAFTAWGANGDWASQDMAFTTLQPLAYVTLAVSCINRVHASFCAVDLE